MYFYELRISYDGINFFGSAKQKNYRTVEGELLRCLNKILNNGIIDLTFAGRTDKFVHAKNQVVSFSIENKIKIKNTHFIFILNKILPNDIRVLYFKRHIEFFNARYDAKKRIYEYLIELPPHNIFKRNYVLQYYEKLDRRKIDAAKNIFIGKHNFLSFSTSDKNNTEREIYTFKYTIVNNLCKFTISANGFLRSQIRMMIASILKYNENKITLDYLKFLLENPKKGAIGFKVSGMGLYFLGARYK